MGDIHAVRRHDVRRGRRGDVAWQGAHGAVVSCAGWVYLYLAWHRLAPDAYETPWLTSCYVFEAVLVVLTVISIFTYTKSYAVYLKRALEK